MLHFIALMLHAMDACVNMPTPAEQRSFLSRRMEIGENTYVVSTYLDWSSGPIHDSILQKFCSAFFAAVTADN